MRQMRFIRNCRALGILCFLLAAGLLATAAPVAAQTAKGEALSQIIAGARREGVINFAGPSSLTPLGARALAAALNKKYGLDLKLHYVPSNNYMAVAAQLVTEAGTGQPPTYDVVYQTQGTIVPLLTRHLLQPVDWTAIFPQVNNKSVRLNGQVLLTDTQFALPAYNSKHVSPQDVPKSWEDFLNPKWKGKIQAPIYTEVWLFLAQMWGEQKTIDYLQKLKEQKPVYGRFPEIETRLASGEYPLTVLQLSPFILHGQAAGAPVAFASQVKPSIVMMDMMGVMKKSRHPNAAKLFAAFTLTREGRAVWWKYAKRSSLFIKGTQQEKFSRGKQLLLPDMNFFITKAEPLERKFGQVLGIR